MTLATLKFGSKDWDDIQLVLHGGVARIISLKNRDSALELNRVLTIAYFGDHEGELSVDIDGTKYTFGQPVWHAILSVVDQWLCKYLPAEHPDFFTDDPDSGERH